MNLDVDYLIDFFTKNSDPVNDEDETGEIGEQEAAAAPSTAPVPSTGGGGGGGSVPKWSDTYQTKRGKSNPLMASGQKWETGLTRGAANQIW
jgi:hypothetical protein